MGAMDRFNTRLGVALANEKTMRSLLREGKSLSTTFAGVHGMTATNLVCKLSIDIDVIRIQSECK